MPPTPAPTSTFAPTALKDDDLDETAARVLGLALKWFIVVLVAIMVVVVALVWLCTCVAKLCRPKHRHQKPANRPPAPRPGRRAPPGPPVAAAPELVAPGRRHVREDVLRQPRDGGDELGETRRRV